MNEVAADTRLHPATLVSRTLRTIPEAAGGMAAYGALVARADFDRLLLLILIGLVGAGAFAFLGWWRFRYGIGAREIVIESGIVRRRRRVIPFERVQDIAIEQRLLARLFGTAHVRIETGGAAADEGHLDSVALAEAHRLRDLIRGGRAASAAAGAETADAAGEPLLFAMPVGRVLYSGLFNFSFIFVAALFAVLQNAEELGLWNAKTLPPGVTDAIGRGWLAATLFAAAAVLLLGVAAGVVRTLARDFGFRLTRAPAGLRRKRGLLTLSEAVMPIRRMQVARIQSGLVTRALGWYGLDFQTLGADPRERGAQAAAPVARMAELIPILAETGFPDPAGVGAWLRSPRRSILRRAAGPAMAAVPAFAAAWLIEPMLAGLGAFLLLLALAAPLRWSRHCHAFGERALFVADGWLRRRTRIMPYGRMQSITVSRTPLQRLLGLATVSVDTAGARGISALALIDLDAADAPRVASRLLERFKAGRR